MRRHHQLVLLQLPGASPDGDAATGDLALRERDVDLHAVALGAVGQRGDPRDPVAQTPRKDDKGFARKVHLNPVFQRCDEFGLMLQIEWTEPVT